MNEETIPDPSGFILPHEEDIEDLKIDEELMELLSSLKEPESFDEVSYFLNNPDELSPFFTKEEGVLFTMMLHSKIGTGAQRGSVTRILNTLKERYLPSKYENFGKMLDAKKGTTL